MIANSRPRSRVNRLLVALALLVAAAISLPASPAQATPTTATYIISAHPDDETSTLYRWDNQTSTYKVFIFATMGEATTWCQNNSAYEPSDGELFFNVSSPGAGGKYSDYCKDSRQYSTLEYLDRMQDQDSGIPNFASYSSSWTGLLSAPGMSNSIPNNLNGPVTGRDERQAEYFLSSNGQGVVIFFDMGDDNLTSAEVEWAVRAVLANKGTFAIPSSTSSMSGIFSNGVPATSDPYSNSGTGYYSQCEPYFHHAHKAVHTAVWSANFGQSGAQYGATCDTDPDQSSVYSESLGNHIQDDSTPSYNVPFSLRSSDDRRFGDYDRTYGWLYNPTISRNRLTLGYWSQGAIHANEQHFWQRH